MRVVIIDPVTKELQWDLVINPCSEHNKKYPLEPESYISETRQDHALFSQHLAKGESPGQCLDNFLDTFNLNLLENTNHGR